MLLALEHAVKHRDMTEELVGILSTRVVDVEYQVKTGVTVRDYRESLGERATTM